MSDDKEQGYFSEDLAEEICAPNGLTVPFLDRRSRIVL